MRIKKLNLFVHSSENSWTHSPYALIKKYICLVTVYTGFRMGIYEVMRFAVFDKEKQEIFPAWYANF